MMEMGQKAFSASTFIRQINPSLFQALACLFASGSIAVGMVMLRFNNRFNVFALGRLIYASLLAAPLFVLLFWLTKRFLLPWLSSAPVSVKRKIILLSVLGGLLFFWLLPPATPILTHPHFLTISAQGRPGGYSTGIQVEIRKLEFLNGSHVPLDTVEMTADWQAVDGIFLSSGAPDSRLVVAGDMPAGIAIYLRYQPEGGLVDITWDGRTQTVDTYSLVGAILPMDLGDRVPTEFPLVSGALVALIYLVYFFGAFILIWIFLVGVHFLTGRKFDLIAYGLVVAVLIGVSIGLKLLYLEIDDPHAMRDSASYAQTSELPLSSLDFWMGSRPFTIPLFLKLFHFTEANHRTIQLLRPLARFQTLFSLVSWAIFAFVLAQTMRRRWFKLAVFGLVLTISLSIQVSLWDAILLAESLSYSLLALMLAGWIGMLVWLPRMPGDWMRWVWVGLVFLVTILYCFCRDSNSYFALVMTSIFTIGWLANRLLTPWRRYILCYAAGVILLFIAQYLTLGAGNRWQVFIYDHLAMRFLKDPEATQFFTTKGLPVTQALMEITEMPGFVYQPLLDQSEQFQAVRDWVTCCSKQAYLQYLVATPLKTLTEPMINWRPLINSSVQGYRNPKWGVHPLPRTLKQLSMVYFNQHGGVVVLFIILNLIGIVVYLRRQEQSAWLVLLAMALTALPMMYFIWLAEPMEVDRHAAQIALQLRLAGWLSVPLLLEALLDRRVGMRKGAFT